jgi:predicted lipoprotein
MNRLLAWFIAIAAATFLFWLFPLFQIVPLERAVKERAAATFNPTQFAEKFWTEHLLKSLDRAVNAEVLLSAIRANAAAARKKYSGRVLAVSADEIRLAVSDGATTPEISLPLGMLFGNAVRDGTGLLNVNDYPNSQDFNGISEALNQLIETRVLPKLRERAKVGATVRFAGCAEVNDESADLKPLKVVAIEAVVE